MHISDKTYDILNDISHLYAPFVTMVLGILAIFLKDSTMAIVTAVMGSIDTFFGITVKYLKAKYDKEHKNEE